MSKKTKIIILIVLLIIGVKVWYYMSKREVEAPETESMIIDDGSLAPGEQDSDMIGETGGDFDGI